MRSYSSETESDEDTRPTVVRTEPVQAASVLKDFDGPIYTAIVVEEFTPLPPSPKVHYNTRSKGIKHESYRDRDLYNEEDEEYQDDHDLSEDYISGDDDVFVAQQVKSSNGSMKERRTSNHTNDQKPQVTKRARKSALPWTTAESKTLSLLVNLYGAKEWQFVAKILQSKHNNNRTAAQCSQRWCRVINPSINKGPWESKEDKLLIEKYDDLQGSWCKIVKFFPDRTDTQCKRRYEKIMQLRTRMAQ